MPEHPQEQLTSYVDGALSQTEAAEVAAHLAECPTCRDTVADLMGVRSLLHRVSVPSPHPSLLPRTLARLGGARRRPVPLLRRFAVAGAVLAAGLLLLQVRLLPPQMSPQARNWFFQTHARLSAIHPMADVSLASYLSTPLPYASDEVNAEGR